METKIQTQHERGDTRMVQRVVDLTTETADSDNLPHHQFLIRARPRRVKPLLHRKRRYWRRKASRGRKRCSRQWPLNSVHRWCRRLDRTRQFLLDGWLLLPKKLEHSLSAAWWLVSTKLLRTIDAFLTARLRPLRWQCRYVYSGRAHLPIYFSNKPKILIRIITLRVIIEIMRIVHLFD